MLDKKLEEAARRRQQNLLVISLVGVIALLGGTLFFLFSSSVGLSDLTSSSDEKRNEKQTASPRPITAENNGLPDPDLEAKRKEFVTLLGRYEEELEPEIQQPGFANWNKSRQQTLIEQKNQAVSDFAAGNTDIAHAAMMDLMVEANTAILEFDKAFQDHLQEASIALDTDQYNAANLAINKALSFKPEDADALALKEKIEALPEILALIQALEIAKAENNLIEEKRLAEKIVALDPDRDDYAKRAKEIEALLIEERYEQIIVTGLNAYNQKKLTSLEQAKDQAKALFPLRPQTRNLEEKVIDLKQQFAFARFLKAASQAIREDRWQDANTAFQNAAALDTQHKEVQDGLDLSRKILDHRAKIAGYLKRPERLSNKAVIKDARGAIQDAGLYGAVSPSLEAQILKLEKEIEDRNRPVEIIVTSDNLTDIQVRGVGKIGKKKQYRIELKPGHYVFEGRREGYKVKSVPVTITTADKSLEVKVIADERI
ncbi:MAG: hypothetical protein ABJN40_21880 [Sneathiella sp.]